MASTPNYRSRFGDTTHTKVFVGGLAWETPSEELHRYFEQFGEILEAVVITDKNTTRSKGYGFVTFREPDSARRACIEPNPIIQGRRANCNIAALGRPRPPPPRGRAQVGNPYQQRGPQAAGPPHGRIPPQVQPSPPPVIYSPYGYVTYTADYGYQQAVFNPQMTAQYHPQMYGTPSPSTMGSPYPYSPIGYTMQGLPRVNFPLGSQGPRMQGPPPPPLPPPPYAPYSAVQGGGTGFIPSSSHQYGFQLQAPSTRQADQASAKMNGILRSKEFSPTTTVTIFPLLLSDSEAPQQQQQPTISEPNKETSPEA